MPSRESTFSIHLVVETAESRVVLAAQPGVRVQPTPDMVREVAGLLGSSCVRVHKGVWVDNAAGKPDRSRWQKSRTG